MFRWRSVAIATTPGARGLEVTTLFRMASAVVLKSALIAVPPVVLMVIWLGAAATSSPQPARRRRGSGQLRAAGSSARRLAVPRSLHREALVAARGHLGAFLPVGPDAARIGQDPARLPFDVRSQVPRDGLRDQARVCSLVVVRHPAVLHLLRRLADCEVSAPHVFDAVADPLGLLLEAGRHVAERGRGREWRRRRE